MSGRGLPPTRNPAPPPPRGRTEELREKPFLSDGRGAPRGPLRVSTTTTHEPPSDPGARRSGFTTEGIDDPTTTPNDNDPPLWTSPDHRGARLTGGPAARRSSERLPDMGSEPWMSRDRLNPDCRNSSTGRALGSQPRSHGFESRFLPPSKGTQLQGPRGPTTAVRGDREPRSRRQRSSGSPADRPAGSAERGTVPPGTPPCDPESAADRRALRRNPDRGRRPPGRPSAVTLWRHPPPDVAPAAHDGATRPRSPPSRTDAVATRLPLPDDTHSRPSPTGSVLTFRNATVASGPPGAPRPHSLPPLDRKR